MELGAGGRRSGGPELRSGRRRWLAGALGLASALVLAPVPVAATSASTPRPDPTPTPTTASAPRPAAATSVPDNLGHLYTLDGYGGLHPAGGAPALGTTAYWQGWDIARALALFPTGDAGYVLDGFGGLHAVGAAGFVAGTAYWRGWDIARGVALAPWSDAAHPAGWVLDGYGGLHPFGGAPFVVGPYWQGWDIARAVVVLPDSQPAAPGGYVLDGWGGVHPFGSAPPVAQTAYWKGWDIARGLSVLPTATAGAPGGYVLDGYGGLHPFGTAPAIASSAYWQGWDIAKAITPWTGAPAGSPGGWVLDGWGGLHSFGSAAAVSGYAYWPGWDIARAAAGSGTDSGSRAGSGARVLGVPYYHQSHPLDCEAAALDMALAYRGIGTTQDAILGLLGDDPRPGYYDSAGNLHWGDPYAGFVGNVNGSVSNLTGYGVFYPPIVAAAQRLGASVPEAGEGISPADIYAAVYAGHPVVAWVSFDWAWHPVTVYRAFDGRMAMFAPTEHAVTVAGVSSTAVLVNNPLVGPQWVSRSAFESAFATFNHMAVVIG